MRGLLVIVAALTAAGCGSPEHAAIVRVQPETNVSQADGAQSEVSVAATVDGKTLVAGSNEYVANLPRTYESTDGGRTWTSRLEPEIPHPVTGCATDPTLAVDAHGRQYYGFIEELPCADSDLERLTLSLYVATRPSAGTKWTLVPKPVASRTTGLDDHPAIAVDTSPDSAHRDRVYVAWAREEEGLAGIAVSYSDDHARTWSNPVIANDTGANDYDTSLAIGRRGEVYVSWIDLDSGTLMIDHSTDGGAHFGTDHTVAEAHFLFQGPPSCGVYGVHVRAQNFRCVRANGTIAVDRSTGPHAGRVYITYMDATSSGGQDVLVAVYTRALHPLIGYPVQGEVQRVNLQETRTTRSDQFMPVSATDPETGDLWVCFYDTAGDEGRFTTQFSCNVSTDGGETFTAPFRAASTRSDETSGDASGGQYGDYQGLAVAGGIAYPVWSDSRELDERGEEIFATALRLRSRG